MDIYENALTANGDHVWTRINKGDKGLFIKNTSDKIVISRVIFDWAKKKKIAFMSIGIDANKYEQICRNAIQNENEGMLICSKNGQEFIRVGEIDDKVTGVIQTEEFLTKVQDSNSDYFEYNNHYVFFSQSTVSGNIIIYMLPKENWDLRICSAHCLAAGIHAGF